MRPLALAICAGLALSPLPAAAAASAGAAPADARCLMTMAALTSSKDEAKARTAQAGVIYFAGRVKADDPSYNFGVKLKDVAASMSRETLAAEAQRCGPILVSALRELDAAQKSFPPAAPAAAAKPPAKPPAKP
ncbi:hypothetical protein LJR225_001470 [Phenylobacterium sp. LjRoot225]|uniref:hypothetical protein n=1 Tax=Phenylobacterium sp. LjRoot225 TaxID=3342285 RepID=UPI003ECCFE07